MSEVKTNPNDLYVIDTDDIDELANYQNGAGVYCAILLLIFLGCFVILKNCPWYVMLGYLIELTCALPLLASLLVFVIKKYKLRAILYDLTLNNIKTYTLVAIVGALLNFVICEATSFLIKMSVEAVVIGVLSFGVIIFSLVSENYIEKIPFRVRKYKGK